MKRHLSARASKRIRFTCIGLGFVVSLLPLAIPQLTWHAEPIELAASSVQVSVYIPAPSTTGSDTLRYSGRFIGKMTLPGNRANSLRKISAFGVIDGFFSAYTAKTFAPPQPLPDSLSWISRAALKSRCKAMVFPSIARRIKAQGIQDPVLIEGSFSGRISGRAATPNNEFYIVPVLLLWFLLVIRPLLGWICHHWANMRAIGRTFWIGASINLAMILATNNRLRSISAIGAYVLGFAITSAAVIALPYLRRSMSPVSVLGRAMNSLWDRGSTYLYATMLLSYSVGWCLAGALAGSDRSDGIFILSERVFYFSSYAIYVVVALLGGLAVGVSVLAAIPFVLVPLAALDSLLANLGQKVSIFARPPWLARQQEFESNLRTGLKHLDKVLFIGWGLGVVVLLVIAWLNARARLQGVLASHLLIAYAMCFELAVVLSVGRWYKRLIRSGYVTKEHLTGYTLHTVREAFLSLARSLVLLAFAYVWFLYGLPHLLQQIGPTVRGNPAMLANGIHDVVRGLGRYIPILAPFLASLIVYIAFFLSLPYLFLLGVRPVFIAIVSFFLSHLAGKLVNTASHQIGSWSALGIVAPVSIAAVTYIMVLQLQKQLKKYSGRIGTCKNAACGKEVSLEWSFCPHCSTPISNTNSRVEA